MMTSIDLTDAEWTQVMQVLSTAPWNVANPLLMKMGGQLRDRALESQIVRRPEGDQLLRRADGEMQ